MSASPDSGADSGAVKTKNFLDPSASSAAQEEPEGLPDLISPDPLVEPEPIGSASTTGSFSPEASIQSAPDIGVESAAPEILEPEVSTPEVSAHEALIPNPPEPVAAPTGAYAEAANAEENSAAAFIAEPEAAPAAPFSGPTPTPPPAVPTPAPSMPTVAQTPPARASSATQLQVHVANLRQVQTNTTIEIPRQLSVVRIGKPNDHTPPDIDVSGFPDSEIVSRVHANIRVEGDTYYLEDIGSSNGTYINGMPLPVGNRHRLRPGDRIALGKGDKVSFIFENS